MEVRKFVSIIARSGVAKLGKLHKLNLSKHLRLPAAVIKVYQKSGFSRAQIIRLPLQARNLATGLSSTFQREYRSHVSLIVGSNPAARLVHAVGFGNIADTSAESLGLHPPHRDSPDELD
jgi:hypothetical protein